MPPKSLGAARAFASAGLFVLDLLAATQPRNAREATATVRAAVEIGVDEVLPLLSRFSGDTRESVQRELVTAWPRFDAETYAQQVLGDAKIGSLEVHDPALVPSVRHLRHVTELSCSVPPLGSLTFVPPQVTKLKLQVPGLVDLSTLDAPGLSELSLTGGRYVDLAPLSGQNDLTSVTITTKSVRNLSALAALPRLSELALLGGCRCSDLPWFGQGRGWPLKVLTLAHIPDLKDLMPLTFLVDPKEIRLERCDRLHRLDGILPTWVLTLRTLALRHTALADLAPLTKLVNLVELDLYGSPVTDLAPLVELPCLKVLTVSSCRTVRDLAPVTRMRHLRELRIAQGGPVNLAGLAGVRDLTILIEGMTRVSGESALGPGSQIKRVSDLHTRTPRPL